MVNTTTYRVHPNAVRIRQQVLAPRWNEWLRSSTSKTGTASTMRILQLEQDPERYQVLLLRTNCGGVTSVRLRRRLSRTRAVWERRRTSCICVSASREHGRQYQAGGWARLERRCARIQQVARRRGGVRCITRRWTGRRMPCGA